MNKVILVGRLTKDPDLKYSPGTGTAVCRFTVAIDRMGKKGETDFINCVAFGKVGETIGEFIVKGRQIALQGNIRTGSYEAQDGTKKYTTDVVVETFDFLDSTNKVTNHTSNSFEETPYEETATTFEEAI